MMQPVIPCILFEDEHLLAVHKPAGIATHRAAEDAPWGMVEFLLNRKPDLSRLGIHQRLDRETSGVLLFAKSTEANQSLANQFEKQLVKKTYLFVTRGRAPKNTFVASEPVDGKPAKTHFRFLRNIPSGDLWEAAPETGRTHQVRIHAAHHGLSIMGDTPVVKQPIQPLLLHAARLELIHPKNGKPFVLEAPMPYYFKFEDDTRRRWEAAVVLRKSLFDETETDAYRLIHRESDGFPNMTVDRLGEWLYVEQFTTHPADALCLDLPDSLVGGVVSGIISSIVRQGERRENKQLVRGMAPPVDFTVMENNIRFRVNPMAPGGIGLFLDQRENRRRVRSLSKDLRILNLFTYTCGFSVAAARGGAVETVSVDLSQRALDWGKQNFHVNDLNSTIHRFLAMDVMKAIRKFVSKKEQYDMVIIDPPSSSHSKESGHFSVKKDFGKLVQTATPLVAENGWLFCSTNFSEWKTSHFGNAIRDGVERSGRKILETVWMPQPFDFPSTQACPSHLKSIWFRLK